MRIRGIASVLVFAAFGMLGVTANASEDVRAILSNRLKVPVKAALQGGHIRAISVSVQQGDLLLETSYSYGGLAQPGSIYDLASLTKAVGTTTATMMMVERGWIKLSDPVIAHLPEFANCFPEIPADLCSIKASITIEHLLRHRSGLKDRVPMPDIAGAIASGVDPFSLYWSVAPVNAPGSMFRYADINFIIQKPMIERILKKRFGGSETFEHFLQVEVFDALRMSNTGFLPGPDRLARVIPTRPSTPVGIPHDPVAAAFGGVSGHAGLFSTISDLRRFVGMLIADGSFDGYQVLKPETVRAMTTGNPRGLGWDTTSPYATAVRGNFRGGFGHTGYTGTSIWVEPARKIGVVILTDRTYNGEGASAQAIADLRRAVANAVSLTLR